MLAVAIPSAIEKTLKGNPLEGGVPDLTLANYAKTEAKTNGSSREVW